MPQTMGMAMIRTKVTTALGATVVLLGLAACGGKTPAATATATGTAKVGGVMTIGSATSIDLLSPVLQTTAWDQVLFSILWDGLVATGKDGKLQPDLATSWSASADQKTWTFQLRPGVKFSNGKALTSADVVSTLAYYKNPKTATEQKNNVAPIAAVKPSGANAVVFTLKAANALFPTSISRVKIVDMAALSGMEKDPAVTGPFKVKEFVADDHLTLERNPSYFGTPAKLDGIKIVKAPDSSAALTALQSGDLDALWSVPLSQVVAIQANPKLAVVKPSVIGQYVSWEVDTTQAPFNNVKARQALAYAIDQKSILAAAYSGQGSISTTNDPLANNNPDYGGNLTDYTYNLDKAKQLFAEAGVTAGSTLTWWGVANQYPEWNISAQILQASLKKIGINLKIQNTDISSWPSKFYPAGKSFPGLIIPNFQSYTSDASDEFQFVLHGRCECNWNNDQFDALYKNAVATSDPAARKAIWQKAQELINQQAPIFVPVQFATVTATKSSVVGLWVDSAGGAHLEDAGFSG
jgi:peptide/nickel transport system substrate-binding protein